MEADDEKWLARIWVHENAVSTRGVTATPARLAGA
jgi:hypothetical protein